MLFLSPSESSVGASIGWEICGASINIMLLTSVDNLSVFIFFLINGTDNLKIINLYTDVRKNIFQSGKDTKAVMKTLFFYFGTR